MDDQSEKLFGRYQALRIYATVSRLEKPEFTTGQLSVLTDVPGPVLSKELARLSNLDVIRSTSRRGDYERIEGRFWEAIDILARCWAE